MIKFKQILAAFLLLACITSAVPSYAAGENNQGGNNQNGNNQGGNNQNGNSQGGKTLPINSGIVFLLVAGVVIGGVMIYKKNKAIKSMNA